MEKRRTASAHVEEVVILVEEEPTRRVCRICHDDDDDDEEEESCSSMESPCACAGSLKFAHRACVQRWCDEKGSTVCEICLQAYEPGYAVAPRAPAVVDVGISNSRSMEATMQVHEQVHEPLEEEEVTSPSTAAASAKGALYCRSLYMALAAVLLLRHLFFVLTLGAEFSASTLAIVFVLRASGIVLPILVIMEGTMMVMRSMKIKQ